MRLELGERMPARRISSYICTISVAANVSDDLRYYLVSYIRSRLYVSLRGSFSANLYADSVPRCA